MRHEHAPTTAAHVSELPDLDLGCNEAVGKCCHLGSYLKKKGKPAELLCPWHLLERIMCPFAWDDKGGAEESLEGAESNTKDFSIRI